MFDLISDIIANGSYEEIEGVLTDLEYYTKRARKALKNLVHNVEYTWTNEQYNITHTGTIFNLKCKEEDIEDYVADYLCDGDLYETAKDLFNELGISYDGKSFDNWVEEFIENAVISYRII